jgi:hypothetical protein
VASIYRFSNQSRAILGGDAAFIFVGSSNHLPRSLARHRAGDAIGVRLHSKALIVIARENEIRFRESVLASCKGNGKRSERRPFKRALHQALCEPHAFGDGLAIDRRYSDFHLSCQ